MAITIQNSEFVRHSAVCMINRYVSFDGLLLNFVWGSLVSLSVVSDFQLDGFW
jgi:hypothetical protein